MNATTNHFISTYGPYALGKKRIVHPGWLAKLMVFALSTAPRFLRVKIMGAIMGGMTKQLN